MSALYAVGWRVRGRPRQWVWSVFPSLGLAIDVARGYAAFDGGGRWRKVDGTIELPNHVLTVGPTGRSRRSCRRRRSWYTPARAVRGSPEVPKGCETGSDEAFGWAQEKHNRPRACPLGTN